MAAVAWPITGKRIIAPHGLQRLRFLFIDESGVRQFAWYDRMRVTAQSQADNLLPLAQIQQAFKQYIADCLRWTEESQIQDLSYDFYQLRLTNDFDTCKK